VLFAIALTFSGGLLPTDSVTFGRIEPQLEGAASPAAVAGLQVGDRVVRARAGDAAALENPDPAAFSTYVRDHQGEPLSLVIERDGVEFTVSVDPVPSEVDGRTVPRIGVELTGTEPEPVGFPGSLVEAGRMTGIATTETIQGVGRIFGPSGLRRMYELLFTDAERELSDPASAVGLAGVAGELSAAGRFFQLLFLFAGINVFVGLLNLLPLPPFDGGHLAVLVIEKIRGRRIDARRLIPVAAVVLTFFVLFTSAAVMVDIIKPFSLP
jgi:membrane-associated protease RseP (regulator of RpoE activity)